MSSPQSPKSYWHRVKEEPARLEHYRARRAKNQRLRRARIQASAAGQTQPPTAEPLQEEDPLDLVVQMLLNQA